MAHPPYKVAVCRRNTPFAFGKNSHIAAQARAACRRRNRAAGVQKCIDIASADRFTVDLLCSRDDNAAHAVSYLFAAHKPGGGGEIADTPVCTGTDHNLIDPYVARLIDSPCVLRQVRKRDGRAD